MPHIRFNFLNLIFIILIALFLSGLQTTFWFQIFGSLPAPQFWLNMILYLILFRKPIEGILTVYLVGLILNPFTAMPLGMIWATLLILFVCTSFVKKRLFWPGSRYFLMASFGMCLAYHVVYFVLSRWLEINPAPISFFHRFFEIVFTTLISVPMYMGLAAIDHLTSKEILPESGRAEQ